MKEKRVFNDYYEIIEKFLRGEIAMSPLRTTMDNKWDKIRVLRVEPIGEGGKIYNLINYSTSIAIYNKEDRTILINKAKISRTTSKIQRLLQAQVERQAIKEVKPTNT